MSYSKETKVWYLTEEGWLSKLDKVISTNDFDLIKKLDYVAKYFYIEEYTSMFDRKPQIKTVCVEIQNDSLRKDLIIIYGECPKSF